MNVLERAGHRQEDGPLVAAGGFLCRVPDSPVQIWRLPLQARRTPGPTIDSIDYLSGINQKCQNSNRFFRNPLREAKPRRQLGTLESGQFSCELK